MLTLRKVTILLILSPSLLTAQETNPLEQQFHNPPAAAQPRTWWHWTNGNVTQEGITKDLEWMKRVGIGGFQMADVAFGGGQTVEPKVEFASQAWQDAVHHAAQEAQRLGLEMAVFSSAGWSLTRRSLGHSGPGHEEAGLERDAGTGALCLRGDAVSTTGHHRSDSQSGQGRGILSGQCRDRLSFVATAA